MADVIKKYLDLTALTTYDKTIKSWVDNKYPVNTVKSLTNVDGATTDPVWTEVANYEKATGVAVKDVTYYSRTGTGTTEDPYVYTAADPQPAVGAAATSYYVTTSKVWNLNLAKFALKSDLVNVFRFKGVKEKLSELPTTGNVQGDIWHVIKDDSKTPAQTINAEYVWIAADASKGVTAHWELLGAIFDPTGSYATKQYVDDAVAAEATARDTAISTAIDALTETVTQAAGTDGLALTVVQEKGKLKSVSGSIAANTYDAYGSASAAETAAKGYTDTSIAGLAADAVGGTDKYLTKVSQSNGVITAEAADAITAKSGITSTATGLVEGKAVHGFVGDSVDAILAYDETTTSYSGLTTTYVEGKINDLDATVRGNLTNTGTAEAPKWAVTEGHNVGVTIVEENGKLTSVEIKENDIASAATLATVNGADTVDGSFRKADKDLKESLKVTAVSGDYLTQIGETDGKIDSITWGTAIAAKGDITSTATGLVQGKAVYGAIDDATTALQTYADGKASAAMVYVAESDKLTTTQINGLQAITDTEINGLFGA